MRKGLLSNQRGSIPSIHNKKPLLEIVKSEAIRIDEEVLDEDYPDDEGDDYQDIGLLVDVSKVIRMSTDGSKNHLVLLKCGHTITSSSTYQGFCKACTSIK